MWKPIYYLPAAAASQFDASAGDSWQASVNGRLYRVKVASDGWAYTLHHGARVKVSMWQLAMPAETVSYVGEPSRPAPDLPRGWRQVEQDEHAAQIASGLVGALPRYHYIDHFSPHGLFRFFAYETPIGEEVISAYRFVGTLGQDDTTTTDEGTTDQGATDQGTSSTSETLPEQTTTTTEAFTDLQSAALDVVNYFASNACTQSAVPAVSAFQTAWNQAGGTPTLTVDGKYGANTYNAEAATLSQIQSQGHGSYTAPANCFAAAATTTTGQTTSEPVPTATATCSWTADATNAQVNQVASSIASSNSPVAWADQGTYQTTTSDGTTWVLVMWWENGAKMVAAYRCVAPKGAAAVAKAGMSWGVVGGVAAAVVTIAAVGMGFAHKGPFAQLGA